MRISLNRSLLLGLAVAVAACADPPTDDPRSPPAAVPSDLAAFVPGELIVKLHTAIDPAAPFEIAGRRFEPVMLLPSGSWLVRLADDVRAAPALRAARTLDAIAALRDDAEVEYAHENAVLEPSLTPSDPLYPQQTWNYGAIRLPAAWDLTTGSSAVRIAILDTGSRAHPDLQARWGPGHDFIDSDADPTDTGTYPHGIHVAGIVGAAAGNGAGGVGVCWNCRLLPLRTSLTFAQIELAIAWAGGLAWGGNPDLGARRAEVINMSFNLPATNPCSDFPGIQATLAAATARGVVSVVSAGNQGFATGPTFPANCPGTIAVAASQPDGFLAPYSNRGPGVDVVAPGGAVFNNDLANGYFGIGIGCPFDPVTPYAGTVQTLSTWSVGNAHCYRYLSGTSMAAPHVTGLVGLMRSVQPSLTPAQIEQLLASTSRPSAVVCPAGACGAGLIDAAAAVQAARMAAMTSPTPGATLTGSSVTFTWTTGSGVSQYHLYVGSSPGAADLYSANQGLATSATVNGLPTDGRALHVRLWSATSAGWQFRDYAYTAAWTPTPAAITSPAPGSTFTGATATFTWTTGSGVTEYHLWVGNTVGWADFYAASHGLSTSGTATGLPTDGRPLHVRLWSATNAGWLFRDYTYTAANLPAAAVLTSPVSGSTLPPTVTFSWTSGNLVSQYFLYVGSSPGAADLYGASQGLATSRTLTGMPTDGRTVHVRLWSSTSAGWLFRDYAFTTTVPGGCIANTACTIDLSGCAEWQKPPAWQGQTSLSGTLQMAGYTTHQDWVCQTSIPQAWPVRLEPGWWCGTVTPQCICSPGDNCH